MKTCDLIINARWIAPVCPATPTLERGAIAIQDGRIIDIGTQTELRERWQARDTIERPQSVLIPGLINAHTHAAMSVMRGIADDLPLTEWLEQHIWPAEGQHASTEMVRDGTRLAMAEMIASGTTCFNDMYFFPDAVASVVTDARMRASIGLIVIEFETAWASGPDEYLSKAMAVYDEHASNPTLSMQFAPHAPYTVSEATLARVHTQADQLDIGVHIHLHETAGEVSQFVEQHGERPFARLERLGMINSNLLAVHMTQLSDDEIALAAQRGISVVHCPESNMKLASGQAPVAAMIKAGVNVALGTDGAASNNDLDMLGEMRSAALLGKITADDASALDAQTILKMATLNGAKALGIDDQVGSLSVGKWADITCIALDQPHTTPVYNPVSTLVFAAGRDDVSDVWVAGRALLKDRQLTTINRAEVMDRAREWGKRMGKT